MSFTNLPTNLNEDAVLVRGAKPDYTKLAADPFPTPSVDEAGAVLENSDNGYRFRWTGTVWILTSLSGADRTVSEDFILEVSKGNIPGHSTGFIAGSCKILPNTATNTIWELAGNYTRLSANTQLYISSTDALDTAVTVLLSGLDDNYNPVTATVTVNGQTQVAFSSANTFRVNFAVVTGSTMPLGDLYIAETDSLTAGVPNTGAKIKGIIQLSRDSSNAVIDTGTEFASEGITHLGFYTVPAGFTFFGLTAVVFVAKNFEVRFAGNIKPFGGTWLARSPAILYQGNSELPFLIRTSIGEKTEIEFRGISDNPNGIIDFQVQFLLVDNDYV
jgi:hypothetical protein